MAVTTHETAVSNNLVTLTFTRLLTLSIFKENLKQFIKKMDAGVTNIGLYYKSTISALFLWIINVGITYLLRKTNTLQSANVPIDVLLFTFFLLPHIRLNLPATSCFLTMALFSKHDLSSSSICI